MIENKLELKKGQRIVVHALLSEKGRKINGSTGVLQNFNTQKQRWLVKLDNGAQLYVKRKNLTVPIADESDSDSEDAPLSNLKKPPTKKRKLHSENSSSVKRPKVSHFAMVQVKQPKRVKKAELRGRRRRMLKVFKLLMKGGTEGEKQNARRSLKKYCKKYGHDFHTFLHELEIQSEVEASEETKIWCWPEHERAFVIDQEKFPEKRIKDWIHWNKGNKKIALTWVRLVMQGLLYPYAVQYFWSTRSVKVEQPAKEAKSRKRSNSHFMDEDRDYIKRFKTEHVRTPSIYGPQVNVKDVMQEYVEICDIFYSHAMDWIETETGLEYYSNRVLDFLEGCGRGFKDGMENVFRVFEKEPTSTAVMEWKGNILAKCQEFEKEVLNLSKSTVGPSSRRVDYGSREYRKGVAFGSRNSERRSGQINTKRIRNCR